MALIMSKELLNEGSDCREDFKNAYQNRYTWEEDFTGYKGRCSWSNGVKSYEGDFTLTNDCKVKVNQIDDSLIVKSISSQLWEVAIHRVRRSFESVHGENKFTVGDFNELGMEVIVGGKNAGDRYRIKDNVITMVYRHIHGSLINIFTKEVINTNKGYLSHKYTSKYLDPITSEIIRPVNIFEDKFKPLDFDGTYVLSDREIITELPGQSNNDKQVYSFYELNEITDIEKVIT
tara:strand:- start:3293 stop:3991 length:699 start_codon:yes stop_codon:yes gene_type:complete